APEPGDVTAGTLKVGTVTVPIHAFSFDASNSTTIGSATGGAGAGQAKGADIEGPKGIDGLTPQTLHHLVPGAHEPTVTVVLYAPGTTTPRATFTFETVFFTESAQSGPDDLEHLKFVFASFTEDIGADSFGWNVVQNKLN